jgi:quercetin dioxygenase-like cupin family protein
MDAKVAAAQPFVRAPAAGSTLNVLGVTHIYKATGAETGGSFSLWEDVVPPGAGAPPHTHAHEDEAFYVLSGEIVIEFEGEPAPRRVASGGFFFGARGRRHAYRNVSDEPARVLVLSAPSCGLDQMFAELDAATAKGMTEIGNLAAICVKYGVIIEPPAVNQRSDGENSFGRCHKPIC